MSEETGWPMWLKPLECEIAMRIKYHSDHSGHRAGVWQNDIRRAIPQKLPKRVFSRIRDRFLHAILVAVERNLTKSSTKSAKEQTIPGVVALLKNRLDGEVISKAAWRKAAAADRSAWNASVTRGLNFGAAAYAADASAKAAAAAKAKAAAEAAANAAAEAAANAALAVGIWTASLRSNRSYDPQAVHASMTNFFSMMAEWLLAFIREEVAAWEAAGKRSSRKRAPTGRPASRHAQ